MSVRLLRNTLVLATLLIGGNARAESITYNQLVGSLGQVAESAPVIDPALLAQEVAANVGQGPSGLPTWGQLANLAQFVVEINFENNSVAIEPDSYRTLGLMADALHHPRLLGYKFLVVGHTSSTGDAKHNLKLSQERADAIMEALSTTFAVPPKHLFAVGVGQELPIDAANPKAAANRRVQLINLGLVK